MFFQAQCNQAKKITAEELPNRGQKRAHFAWAHKQRTKRAEGAGLPISQSRYRPDTDSDGTADGAAMGLRYSPDGAAIYRPKQVGVVGGGVGRHVLVWS